MAQDDLAVILRGPVMQGPPSDLTSRAFVCLSLLGRGSDEDTPGEGEGEGEGGAERGGRGGGRGSTGAGEGAAGAGVGPRWAREGTPAAAPLRVHGRLALLRGAGPRDLLFRGVQGKGPAGVPGGDLRLRGGAGAEGRRWGP